MIRPPYLSIICGHIREVAFGEREKYIHYKWLWQRFVALLESVASVIGQGSRKCLKAKFSI